MNGATVRVALPQTNLVLSLVIEPETDLVDQSGSPVSSMPHSISSDPIIGQLLREIAQAREELDGGVRADAIRLAVVARWLGLHARSIAATRDGAAGTFQQWRLNRVLAYIDENIGDPITLMDLARTAGVSRMYLAAQFRMATGLRPREYILRRRVERAKTLLAATDRALAKIAEDAGFETLARFTTIFKRFAGMTPGQWRLSQRRSL